MNLWLSFNKAVTLWPDREGLVDGDKRFTYRQFGQRVANVVQKLNELSIGKGDVAGIIAPNCHEFMEIYFACAISGVVLSPINYRLNSQEIETILEHAEAKALFVHTDFQEVIPAVAKGLARLGHAFWFGSGERPEVDATSHDYQAIAAGGSGRMPELPDLKADDLAQLYYTSGTTGKPKGVMLTHGNVTFNALAVTAELSFKDRDTWLHAAPLFHLADAWSVFAITWVGGRHVFLPYFKPDTTLKAIADENVTMTVLVPTMLNAMLHEETVDSHQYDSLRAIMTGGSPIAPETVKRTVTTFGCDYIQLYGMTETSPFLTLSLPKSNQEDLSANEQLDIRMRTGRPYIGAEVKVVRPDGTEVERDNKEVGEIIARGPTITPGYWKQPEITAQTIKNGWIYTGDLAVIDKEGVINIVDRKKDMIITGGENVYSTEVEYTLKEHAGVKECAVFGIPDEKWGEAIKAVVVPTNGNGPTEAELIEFVQEKLARYKAPRSVDFVKELPKTGSGKIFKAGLREKYWADHKSKVI